MAKRPSRIDLLELDIDVRLADLWREANDISEWSLEVVGAFIRAAYGKGYCDALTEDAPGSLCVEHGYRVPERRVPERPADNALSAEPQNHPAEPQNQPVEP
jgi:hypothetical protein